MNASAFLAIDEATYALLGVGFFLVALGWFIHQRYLFQRLPR